MAKEGQTFGQWSRAAKAPPERLNDPQRAVLRAAFEYLQHTRGDCSSLRIASHFLPHFGLGLKVAQIARLIGISTRSAFCHEKLSAMQAGGLVSVVSDDFVGTHKRFLTPLLR